MGLNTCQIDYHDDMHLDEKHPYAPINRGSFLNLAVKGRKMIRPYLLHARGSSHCFFVVMVTIYWSLLGTIKPGFHTTSRHDFSYMSTREPLNLSGSSDLLIKPNYLETNMHRKRKLTINHTSGSLRQLMNNLINRSANASTVKGP